MSDTDAYKTPLSKLAGSESKLMVLSCNRIAAGTLLKVMILGSVIGLTTILTILYSLSLLGGKEPDIELYAFTGVSIVDFVLVVLIGSLFQGLFAFIFAWLGLFIYSRFFDIKVTLVRSKA
ncbi:hypothetical protein DWB84_18895 [Saccharophagus sp. K07]|jgi:hypothetical protein|uniref:hypothetical protein n=1 Tax=Saccharophagus sp. K07 TaxID=2283636 RepID=UPI001651DA39|nr:hypothetical protein [Saccharophagus sp. K07]MBC6907507.1 hypothetical protein [Saccharophagus sp. K07]